MKAKQLHFFHHKSFTPFTRTEHGGDLNPGRRKLYRPVATDRPMHVTLHSHRARGEWSLLHPRNANRTKHLVHQLAKRFNVRVYQYANSGNHLHLLIRSKDQKDFQKYLKALAGTLARVITGAKKGVKKGPFWAKLAYSRIVQWGKDFLGVRAYLLQNELEGLGVIPYSPRKPRAVRRP